MLREVEELISMVDLGKIGHDILIYLRPLLKKILDILQW